jgi:hypothetical protein
MIARSGGGAPPGESYQDKCRDPHASQARTAPSPCHDQQKGPKPVDCPETFLALRLREHDHAIGFAGWVIALTGRSSNAFCRVGRGTARVRKQEINSAESCRCEWAVVRKRCSRTQLLTYIANVRVWVIGMETCSGAHFLGRALQQQGHDMRLMPAQYVKPARRINEPLRKSGPFQKMSRNSSIRIETSGIGQSAGGGK